LAALVMQMALSEIFVEKYYFPTVRQNPMSPRLLRCLKYQTGLLDAQHSTGQPYANLSLSGTSVDIKLLKKYFLGI